MKVIQLYKSETQLIRKAIKQNREAQHKLYGIHAPKMLSVCRQYIKDIHFAEEVMLNGFLKVFANLKKFKFEGSFEGWIRRIMINESISFLRKEKKIFYTEELTIHPESFCDQVHAELEVEQIQNYIDSLPNGYRMVFVLYAIEGYKHSEIAKMLEISENTSKSQLSKARKMLQQKLNQQNLISNGAIEI